MAEHNFTPYRDNLCLHVQDALECALRDSLSRAAAFLYETSKQPLR